MKKGVKTTAALLVGTMAMGVMSGCSLFDKAGKQCTEVGNEFIEAMLEHDSGDMADLCYDDDEAEELFAQYDNIYEGVDALLEKATYEAGKPDCSTKDGKGTIEYTITIPDYDAAFDEDPEDVDEFADLLDDIEDTVEIKLTLKFKLHKEDWLINNPDDIAEDFFDELLDIEFPFTSDYTEWIDEGHFYNSTNGTYTNVYYLDYDINPVSEHYYDDWEYSFKVFDESGREIYDSGRRTDYGLIENYCYLSDTEYANSYTYFPAGSYTFILYDTSGRVITTDTCTVVNNYD